MSWFAINVALLSLALALAVVAGLRRWSPPLYVSIVLGAALRIAVLVLESRHAWQPYDFFHDLRGAGQAVLAHKDPILTVGVATGRAGAWHFLPLMAYFYAGVLSLDKALHASWLVTGRILPVVADVCLIWIVGRLAGSEKAATRSFQYACMPIAILVSGLHGQIEPIALALGASGLLLARRGRPLEAGGLLGLAISANTWPVLLLPAFFACAPSSRERLRLFGASCVAPFVLFITMPLGVGTPLSEMGTSLRSLLSHRSIAGSWSWTAVLYGPSGSGTHGTAALALVPLLAVAGAWWLWRKADPVDLASVVLVAFVVTSPDFGAQYLVWFAPFLVARPTRSSLLALGVASIWAGVGYLYLTGLADHALWEFDRRLWDLASLAVAVPLVACLPWERRRSWTARTSASVPASPAIAASGSAGTS